MSDTTDAASEVLEAPDKAKDAPGKVKDALIIFTPSGIRGRFPIGTPVLTAAQEMGVDLDSVCGRRGICSKCQVTPCYGEFPKHGVTVEPDALSEWNSVEERYKRIRGIIDGRRLGCQALIMGDVVVDVPPESQVHRQVVRKSIVERHIDMDPATRPYYVEVEEPDMHHPSGDLDRLEKALREQWNIEKIEVDLSIMRRLQPVLRKGEWKVTVILNRGNHDTAYRVLDIRPGFNEDPLFGLAVDLGSTTIAAHICNLSDGSVLASAGMMNPQIRFGEDLMSRVSYAMMNPGGDVAMTKAVREAINELARTVCREARVKTDTIFEMVLVCNPIMHHLFLGIDPVELGQAPFALAVSEGLSLNARDLELNTLNTNARVYVLPCIAGHVGADSAAVALSEEPNKSEDMVLVVDVGTNAELLLGNKERVLACSSPTGPALEGAQISSGQRAAPGAIERVEIDPVTKEPRFRVIGVDLWSDEPGFREAVKEYGVTGICGSGIIEVIAEMRAAGIVDRSGLVGSAEQTGTRRCIPHGRTHSYILCEADLTETGHQILVTQADVRAIQLAKSALYAGAKLLMEELGIDHVDRVVLAGAFGAHISPKHAMILGFFPDVPIERITNAGNAAGTGARIALLNRESRNEIERTVHEIHKVETAIAPHFQDFFVNANAFPNLVDPFPELAKIVTLPEPSFNANPGETGRRRRRGSA